MEKKLRFGLFIALLFLIANGLSPNMLAQGTTGWVLNNNTWTWGTVTGTPGTDYVTDFSNLAGIGGGTPWVMSATDTIVINATGTSFVGWTLNTIASLTTNANATIPDAITTITGDVSATSAATLTLNKVATIGGTLTTGTGALTATALTGVTGATNISGESEFAAGVTFAGTSSFAGAAIFSDASTFAGNAIFSSTSEFTGAATFSGAATLNGTAKFTDDVTFDKNVIGNGSITFTGASASCTTVVGAIINVPVVIPSTVTLTDLTNAGTITTLTNAGTITAGTNTGAITTFTNNAGTITAFTNEGTITTLTNEGTITAFTNEGTITTLTNEGTITTFTNVDATDVISITNANGSIDLLINNSTKNIEVTDGNINNLIDASTGETILAGAAVVTNRYNATHIYDGVEFRNLDWTTTTLQAISSKAAIDLPNGDNVGIAVMAQMPADIFSQITSQAMPGLDFAQNVANTTYSIPSHINLVGNIYNNKGAKNVVLAFNNSNVSIGAIKMYKGSELTIKNTAGVGAKVTVRTGSPSVDITGAGTILNFDTTSVTFADLVSVTGSAVMNVRIGDYRNQIIFEESASANANNYSILLGGGDNTEITDLTPGTLNIVGTGQARPDGQPSVWIKGIASLSETQLTVGGTITRYTSNTNIGTLNIRNAELRTDMELGIVTAVTATKAGKNGTLDLTGTDCNFNALVSFVKTTLDTINVITDKNTSLKFMGTVSQTTFPDCSTPRELFDLYFGSNTAADVTINGDLHIYGDFLTNAAAGGTVSRAHKITINGATPTINMIVDGRFADESGTFTLTDALNLTLNGTVLNTADYASLTGATLSLTFGGIKNNFAPLPAATVALLNLTINNAQAEIIANADIVISNNLNITAGTLNANAYDIKVDANTTIEPQGALLLTDDVSAIIAGTPLEHIFGTNGNNTFTNNGLLDIRGRQATYQNAVSNTATFNAIYSGTGAVYTNEWTELKFNGDANLDIPASIRDLNSLTLDISENFIATMSNDITMWNTTQAMDITSGTIKLAGNKLELLSIPAKTGVIDATGSGSTLEVTGAFEPTAVVPGAYTDGNLLTDLNTILIINNGAAAPVDGAITQLKDLTIHSGNMYVGARALTINTGITGVVSSYTNATNNLTIAGNLNIIGVNNTASFIGSALTLNLNNVTVSGTTAINAATADLSGSIVNITGALNAGVVTTNATILNVIGTSEQFQIPQGVTALGKLTLNRPSGLRLNLGGNNVAATPLLTLGSGGIPVALDIQKGLLDLNGYNITFANANNTMLETPGAYVTNTGTSYFATTVTNSKGAIYNVEDGTLAQINSIGITLPAGSAVDNIEAGDYRRYPKTVYVPETGIGLKRYYYANPNGSDFAAGVSSLGFYYDRLELNGNETSLGVYLEAVGGTTTDAFSNAELLKGQTSVTSSTPNSLGSVTVSNMLGGSTYGVTVANLNCAAYIFALASSGGSGSDKVWTNSTGDGMWQTANNWEPAGVPAISDQVIIARANGTITITNKATCGNLWIDGDDVILKGGFVSGNTQDTATLIVTGNINIEGASILDGQALNLQIGDGQTQGVETQIFAPYTDAGFNQGIIVNNVSVNMATLKPSNGMYIKGNLELIANSTLDQTVGEDIVFYGVHSTPKTFKMSAASAASFGNIKLTNTAKLTTDASFIVKDAVNIMDAASSFEATAGSIIFNQPNQTIWVNPNNGNLVFNNVEIGSALTDIPDDKDMSEPIGSATFRGTFLKTNESTFYPIATPYTTGGNGEYAIYFDNPRGATTIENSSIGNDKLNFHNLVIKTAGTKTTTESNFNVKNYLQVRDGSSLIASAGTITMNGTGEMTIENQSDQTLIFNNLDIKGIVTSATSWKIAGDMTIYAGAFNSMRQSSGVITITNNGMRKGFIDNSTATVPAITVNKLLVDSTSIFVTGGTNPNNATASFEIKNYDNGMPSGLELQTDGKIEMPSTGIIYFSTDGNVNDTAAKYIINNGESADMSIGNIVINSGKANNRVKTASNFNIIGIDNDLAIGNFVVNSGGIFEATDGTISFAAPSSTASTQVISSITPASAYFNNLRADYSVILNLSDNSEIFVAGDMIMDSNAKFVAGTPGTSKAIVNLNSHSKAQHLTGTTNQTPAFEFTYLQIDKVDANINDYTTNPYTDDYGVVYIENTTKITTTNVANPSALILTSGVLNLGKDTLIVGAQFITRHNGAIDGAEGTYIIDAIHQTPKLEDALFTVGGNPTLYNLVVNAAHQATNNLTVNNDLTLGATFTLAPASVAGIVEPKLLTLYGNLVQSSATGLLASGSVDNTMSRLVLKGTGIVQGGLKNELFNGNSAFSITVARGETLGGALTMNGSNLTIQTGVNTLALNSNTLTLSATTPTANPTGITIISGNLTADVNSVVKFNGLDIVPANMFAKSEAGTLDLTGGVLDPTQVEFRGNVIVNRALVTPIGNVNFRIITDDNILTLAAGCTDNFSSATRGANGWIVGNLVRSVSNSGKVLYPIGSMTEFAPLQMRYANNNTQSIMATVNGIDPTQNRGGNPKNSENYEWNINPVNEEIVNDSLIVEFGWANDNGLDVGLVPSATTNNTFAARWDGTQWIDYRNTISSYASSTVSANMLSPQTGKYPVANSNDLTGTWAVFVANNGNDQSKDSAISTNMNKIVIKEITPTAVVTGRTFKVTVGLEDPLGQEIIPTSDVEVNFTFVNPSLGATFTSNNSVTISAGKNEASVQLQLILNAGSTKNGIPNAQIMADANDYVPTVSNYFSLLPDAPMAQADNIEFSKITYTSAKATWSNHGSERVLIIAKADTLLTETEMPVNATTYIPNAVYGAGTNVGNAVILYDGPATANTQSIEINGLLPNSKYYIYAFAYNGINGAENYKTTAATRNPNVLETLLGNNDDITLGNNNDYQTSATVGTNAPIKGMIYSTGDVDCFNFMVTSAAPNVRVLLTDLPGNYTLELYDFTGRRIRRSTLINNSDEAMVINNLPAGTFVVKVFSEDGSIWQKDGDEYNLLINTYSKEIFSVTPKP